MQLIECSMLSGYVIAIDDENEMLLYYYAESSFSNEVISKLQQYFEDWPILLTNSTEKAKALCNNAEISYKIDCVSAAFI